MPYCNYKGHKLYYELLSNTHKQNLVLVQGMGSTHHFWMGLDADLAKHFNVLVYDNRGVGRSSVPITGYSIKDMEKDLSAILKEIGWTKYAILGVSMGGFIAQKHAILHQEKLSHLILASTHPGVFHAVFPKFSSIQMLSLTNKFVLDMNLPVVQKLVSGTDLSKTRPELLKRLDLSRKLSDIPYYGYQGHVRAGMTFTGIKHEKITIPVLLIHGANDKVVPVTNVDRFYKRFKNTKVVSKLYQDAGHLVLWEKQESVVQDILQFLLE